MTPEQRATLRRLDRQFDAVRAMPEPIPARDRYRHGIEDIGHGAYVRLNGALFQVVGTSYYEEKKGSRWHELELFGLESGITTWVEWEKDDEVEISLNCEELSLADVGATADQIEEMSDAEAGKLSHGGRTYFYDDDYGATYHREAGSGEGKARGRGKPGGDGEKVYFYDFETKDERYSLSVEEWGDESSGYEYAVFVSEYIEPETVDVVALHPDGRGQG